MTLVRNMQQKKQIKKEKKLLQRSYCWLGSNIHSFGVFVIKTNSLCFQQKVFKNHIWNIEVTLMIFFLTNLQNFRKPRNLLPTNKCTFIVSRLIGVDNVRKSNLNWKTSTVEERHNYRIKNMKIYKDKYERFTMVIFGRKPVLQRKILCCDR